jgi:hypothetical protein
MTHPNLEMLRIAVENLGTLADEMVFVGGCTTGLLINDEGAAPEVRATDDVDSIVARYIIRAIQYVCGEAKENTLPGRHSGGSAHLPVGQR